MTHTPGPWIVQPVKGSFQVPFHILSEDGRPVAYCDGQQLRPDRTSVGEARANAHLIAAAPELLGELKYLVEEFEEAVDWVPAYVAMADRAKAAIAKAEGRE